MPTCTNACMRAYSECFGLHSLPQRRARRHTHIDTCTNRYTHTHTHAVQAPAVLISALFRALRSWRIFTAFSPFSIPASVRACERACVCACVRACERASERACVHVRVCARTARDEDVVMVKSGHHVCRELTDLQVYVCVYAACQHTCL